jgi:crossover junction endodeoxyribonuclease RuvC
MVAASLQGLTVHEYSPSKVKQSVVGHGRAKKEQVQKMVAALLKIPTPDSLDTSDALAVAICYLLTAPTMAILNQTK